MSDLTEVVEFRLKLYPKNFITVKGFYQDVLGYPVIEEWDRGPEDRGVMFAIGKVTFELLTPKKYQPVQGIGLSLEVRNLDFLWENMKDRVYVLFPPRHNEWGDTSFCIADPEGFELTFFQKDSESS